MSFKWEFYTGTLAGPHRDVGPALTQRLDYSHDTSSTDDTKPLRVREQESITDTDTFIRTRLCGRCQDEELITKKENINQFRSGLTLSSRADQSNLLADHIVTSVDVYGHCVS